MSPRHPSSPGSPIHARGPHRAARTAARAFGRAATLVVLLLLAAVRPGRAAAQPPAAPVCDTAPAPARWADQFRRRHAVAAAAPRAHPAARRVARPRARAATRPSHASRSQAARRHLARRRAGPPTGAVVLPRRAGIRVRKVRPAARAACPARRYADVGEVLAPPAYGDALAEAFGAPLTDDGATAPAEDAADGDAQESVRRAAPGGLRVPRLGWGPLAVGAGGTAVAVGRIGGSPAKPDGWSPPRIGAVPLPGSPATPIPVVPIDPLTSTPSGPPTTPPDSTGPPPPIPPGDGPPRSDPPGSNPPRDAPPTAPLVPLNVVPEPGSALLVGAGLVAAAVTVRRRRG
jgi:hypothetical protein